jgi:hypothetical protein
LELPVVVLGLLLLVLSGLLTAGMVLQNTDPAAVSLYGHAVTGVTIGGLFAAGVVTGAVALLGLIMMLGGARRRRARRVGLKQEVRDVRVERETLAEENARLRRELETSRTTTLSDAPAYPDTGRHIDTEADADADATAGHGLFHR